MAGMAIDVKQLTVTLIGDSPLICERWTQRDTDTIMHGRRSPCACQPKVVRDLEQEYRDRLYTFPDGTYGFPAIGVKAALVSAARFRPVAGLSMTDVKCSTHIPGELVPVTGTPQPRHDSVVMFRGDREHAVVRAEFPIWTATVSLNYNAARVTEPELVTLFDAAGFGVGLGTWRPEKNGIFGRFHVSTNTNNNTNRSM